MFSLPKRVGDLRRQRHTSAPEPNQVAVSSSAGALRKRLKIDVSKVYETEVGVDTRLLVLLFVSRREC